MLKSRLFALFLFLHACALSHAQAAGGSLHLVSLDYPPYSYKQEGQVVGIAVEIVKGAFKKAGYRVSVDIVPWARALESVKKGKADGIFTIYKNEKRETFLTYSNEILMPQVVSFFKRKDRELLFDGNLESVRGLRLSVVNRVSYGKSLDALIEAGEFSQVERNNTLERALLLLLGKRVDLVPSNRLVAYHKIADIPELKELVEVKPPITDIPSYIAFTRQRDMTAARDAFDAGIRQMKKSGRYDAIVQSYITSSPN